MIPASVKDGIRRVATAAGEAEVEARVYAPLWPVGSLRPSSPSPRASESLVDVAMFDRLVRRYDRAGDASAPTLSLDVAATVPGELVEDDPSRRSWVFSTLRATVLGQEGALAFLRTDELPRSAALMVKQRVRDPRTDDYLVVSSPSHGFRVSAKRELSVPPEDPLHARAARYLAGPNLVRQYRLKNRRSFPAAGGLLRVDLTVVKAAEGLQAVSSGLLAARDAYEVEVEVVGSAPPDRVAEALLEEVTAILAVCQDTPCVFSFEETRECAASYFLKVFGFADIPDQAARLPRRFFSVPQPVTLELRNCLPPDVDVVSIMTPEYTVTEKADGERCLVYVAPSGRASYLTNRLVFRGLAHGIPQCADSLFDAEHVTRDVAGRPTHLFLLFDCYRFRGKDVSGDRLRDRLERCAALADQVGDEVRVRVKRFRFAADESGGITAACSRILAEQESGAFEYHTDGLIFTPEGPVPARDPPSSGTAPPQRSIGGTCDTVFKWKPVSENTIDMLVRFDPSDVSGVDDRGRRTARCVLLVGNNHRHQPLDPVATLTAISSAEPGRRVIPPSDVSATDEFMLGTADLPLTEDLRHGVAENGDLIRPNSVVEFRFAAPGAWTPTRVRMDKTELFATTGSALGAANDYRTAMNVLSSIQHPVTADVLTGRRAARERDVAELYEDVYYADARGGAVFASGDVSRHLEDMRAFHNRHVKGTVLIGAAAAAAIEADPRRGDGGLFLFDVACGKGGDLPKWRQHGFGTVVGVDLSLDNLVNPVNGAYARLLRYATPADVGGVYGRPPSSVAFLQMDSSLRWTPSYLRTLASSSPATGALVSHAFRLSPDAGALGPHLARLHGVALRGADVVSCMFAIHYFCKSEAVLSAFCQNVAMVLADGGRLVGCCMDGHEVLAQLNAAPSGTLEGVDDASGATMWRVRRTSDLSSAQFDDRPFGRSIEVFVSSIGKRAVEYLVHFPRVEEAFRRHGIRLIASGMFSDVYPEWAKDGGMGETARRFSFLNRYFVMSKDPPV